MGDRAALRDEVSRGRNRRRWLAIPGILFGWIVLTIVGVIPGLIVPPAILPGGKKDLEPAMKALPRGSEVVEIPLEDGERLRGVFVPSVAGSPVVLHLLESSGSVSSTFMAYDGVLAEMAEEGFASLMVDYRGVGASDGDRSPRHLEEDARAMWAEAVRRAEGDPGRVVVRSVSIGTIPAAILSSRGAHPAGWILIAPVRGETVVRHFAEWQYPGVLARIASTFFRPVADIDVVATVRRMREPLWVVSPEHDVLLAEDEQASLREGVEAAGGKWTVSSRGHELTTLGAHALWSSEEAELLATLIEGWPDRTARSLEILERLPPDVAARFPPGSAQRLRLAEISILAGAASPDALAAAALEFEDPTSAAQLVRRNARRQGDWLDGLRFEEVECILDLRDPAGELPLQLVGGWAQRFQLRRSQSELTGCFLAPDSVLDLVRQSEVEAAEARERMHWTPMVNGWNWDRYPCCELWKSLRGSCEVSTSEVRRRAARVLLKAAAIPDRVVAAGDGAFRLEIREEGEWRTVPLDWPEPSATAALSGNGVAESR